MYSRSLQLRQREVGKYCDPEADAADVPHGSPFNSEGNVIASGAP